MNTNKDSSRFSDTEYYKQFQDIDDDIPADAPAGAGPAEEMADTTPAAVSADEELSPEDVEQLMEDNVSLEDLSNEDLGADSLSDMRFDSSVAQSTDTSSGGYNEQYDSGDEIVYRSAQLGTSKRRRVISYRRSYRRRRRWRRRVFYAIACTIFLAVLAFVLKDFLFYYTTGETIYARAAGYHENQDYAKAATEYQNFFTKYKSHPKRATAMYYWACCLDKAGRPDEALKAFQQFTQQYPESMYEHPSYFWLGELLLNKKNKPDLARDYYQLCLAADSDGAFARQAHNRLQELDAVQEQQPLQSPEGISVEEDAWQEPE